MTSETVVLNGSYNSEKDFAFIEQAVQQLTQATQEQFEQIKKEKWFTRLFDMLTFSQKGKTRTAEQISSLAQAQDLLFRILVKLSETDGQVADLVRTSMEDIQRLAGQNVKLLRYIQALENNMLGIREADDISKLSELEKQILCESLNRAMGLFKSRTAEQQDYANRVLTYLHEPARIRDLDKALERCAEDSRRKILACIMEYMYLFDRSLDFSPECQEFIEEFNIGQKTIQDIKGRIKDTVSLRGEQGLMARFPLEELPPIEEEFFLDFTDVEPEVEDEAYEPTEWEEITLSGIMGIAEGERKVFREKIIHFTAKMNCEGALDFDRCVILYGEQAGVGEIIISSRSSITMTGCVVRNFSYTDKFPFIHGTYRNGKIRITSCKLINCCGFIGGSEDLAIENSSLINPMEAFIKNTNNLKISGCDISFPGRPAFFPEDKSLSANSIACSTLEMSDCAVKAEAGLNDHERKTPGDLIGFATIGITALAYGIMTGGDSYFLRPSSGQITHCSFSNMGRISWGADISFSTFDRCEDISAGSVNMQQCRFDSCTSVAEGDKVRLKYCQFNDCSGGLIHGHSGSEIRLCEFNNWTGRAGIDMLYFKQDDSKASGCYVQDCIFNGINAGDSLVIKGRASKHTKNEVLRVKDCRFTNWKTERPSGQLINSQSTYYGAFRKEKQQKIVFAYNCSGLGADYRGTKDTQGSGHTDGLKKRLESDSGELFGPRVDVSLSGWSPLPWWQDNWQDV